VSSAVAESLAICGYFRPHQTKGGWASFFQNLLRGIHEVVEQDDRYRNLEVTLFHNPHCVPYRCDRFEYRPQTSRGGRFGADAKFGLLASRNFDAAFFPSYFRPPVVRSRRSVVTVHDLLNKNFPELLSRPQRIWLSAAQKYALRRADAMVTISETVKQDVMRYFGERFGPKIHPIWNPIAFERLDGDLEPAINAGRPYLLGVALDRPHKNLSTLVRAFARLRQRHPDLCLVLVGELRSHRPKANLAAEVDEKMPAVGDVVRDLGLEEHVKITGFISDAELGALYRGAAAFILPSLHEGFGMPAIEALGLGAPTLVSDIPVFREVTVGVAEYLPQPRDPDSVCEHVDQVISRGPAARPTPENVAKIRRLFAPATIARQYLKVILGD
jgi:glycosyltransferase involved in cell wall biosynthesis